MADLDDIKEGKDFGIDRPQQNTLYTLKGCGSLDWGMQSRLARIFNPHSNRTVMLAFDHGYFQGPTTGLERIDLSIAPLFADTDVLMCTRGVLRSQVPAATNKPVVLRASGEDLIVLHRREGKGFQAQVTFAIQAQGRCCLHKPPHPLHLSGLCC